MRRGRHSWKKGRNHFSRGRSREREMPLTFVSVVIISAFLGLTVGVVSTRLPRANTSMNLAGIDKSKDRYFRRCSDAWAAGFAPMNRGEPGYREGLDGDGDGIACEPYRGR